MINRIEMMIENRSWIKDKEKLDEGAEEEVNNFLFCIRRGKKLERGDLWGGIQAWMALGRHPIPSPSIDVKFLNMNSSTLHPILR